MAHFAELDINNKVLRVNVACNIDIQNNGGEQSEQAAEHFKTVSPLSENGVKWVQTSYNNNFRKQHAAINYIYDSIKDKFIRPQPYQSWSLDNNDDWQPPIPYPITYTLNLTNLDGNQKQDPYIWNEVNQSWDLQPIS
jgi:hypothetical protein